MLHAGLPSYLAMVMPLKYQDYYLPTLATFLTYLPNVGTHMVANRQTTSLIEPLMRLNSFLLLIGTLGSRPNRAARIGGDENHKSQITNHARGKKRKEKS